MQGSELFEPGPQAKPRGIIMVVNSAHIDESKYFEVALDGVSRDIQENIEVLSHHYLDQVLERVSVPILDARVHFLLPPTCSEHLYCNQCPRGCPNAALFPYPHQSLAGYVAGIKLVHLKSCRWASIVHERYCIGSIGENRKLTCQPLEERCRILDAQGRIIDHEALHQTSNGDVLLNVDWSFQDSRGNQIPLPVHSHLMKQYAVKWMEHMGSESKRISYYTKSELNPLWYVPPLSRAVYPHEVGAEVITIGFHPDKRQTRPVYVMAYGERSLP